jgi:ankyrin repeat protein
MKLSTRYTLLLLCLPFLFWSCGTRPEDKLIEAAAAGDVRGLQRQLALGVNVDCKSRGLDQSTPLIWAVQQRRGEAVAVLLTAGADTNVRDAHKNTALFYAFTDQEDLGSIIKELILAGASSEEYTSLFFSLPQNNPNRVAFEAALKERSNRRDGRNP